MELQCSNCRTPLSSRRARLCSHCGAPLPVELLPVDEQPDHAADELTGRKPVAWIADRLAPHTAGEREGGPDPQSSKTTPASSRGSLEAERHTASRPFGLSLHFLSFLLFLLLLISLWLSVGPITLPMWLLILALPLVFFWVMRAANTPVCPACHQNIRSCTPLHCHGCGNELKDKRCTPCAVDYTQITQLPIGDNGLARLIAYCPGCGVSLDTSAPRREGDADLGNT